MRKTMENKEFTSNLTVSDLVNIKNIIDVASARGSFRGEELSAVGEVYNKLAKFIDSITEALENSSESDESDNEEPTGE
jgi:hypothetical protein